LPDFTWSERRVNLGALSSPDWVTLEEDGKPPFPVKIETGLWKLEQIQEAWITMSGLNSSQNLSDPEAVVRANENRCENGVCAIEPGFLDHLRRARAVPASEAYPKARFSERPSGSCF